MDWSKGIGLVLCISLQYQGLDYILVYPVCRTRNLLYAVLHMVPIFHVMIFNDVILENIIIQNHRSIFLGCSFILVRLLSQVAICNHDDYNWLPLKCIKLIFDFFFMFFRGLGIRMIEPVYLSPSFDNVLPSHLFLQVYLFQNQKSVLFT